MSFFLLFLYTYANFLIKNGQVEIDKEIEKEKNSAPEGCTPSETRERGADGARGDSRWVSLLTDWESDSEPYLSSIQQVRKPFSRHSQTLEA